MSTLVPSGRELLREEGRERRKTVPRRAHAEWARDSGMDPIDLVKQANAKRVQSLVPVRMARMSVSAFAFYRGSADIMAADLADTPVTGIDVQLCGDAHLGNFGLFASPERELVFDVNDFDETAVGPWEWDVKRLAASALIAARQRGFSPAQALEAATASVASYRRWIRTYADEATLDVWYERVSAERVVEGLTGRQLRRTEQALDKSRQKTSETMLRKLTVTDGSEPRIVDQPPLIEHIEVDREDLQGLYQGYLESLPDERQQLVRQFHVVDFARKVVGVGSVGTGCYVALLLDDTGAPLFLQIKEAGPSAVAAHTPSEAHQGRRVVSGQRLMQATSDQFLGWSRTQGHDAYVRQLADMKGGVRLDRIAYEGLLPYVGACGWALARAHARSGSAAAIAGYLGGGDVFDRAVARFSVAYADQNEHDYGRLCAAIDAGMLPAHP